MWTSRVCLNMYSGFECEDHFRSRDDISSHSITRYKFVLLGQKLKFCGSGKNSSEFK